MDARHRSGVALGVIIVLIGIWFLVVEWVPGLGDWVNFTVAWPVFIVAIGLVMLGFAVFGAAPGLAVPACVIGGIGLLLYWQNVTNNWQSWAYGWTLIPGFVGVGTLIMGLLGVQSRRSITGGIWLMIISGFLFLIFGSFLGGPDLLGQYWPALLIALGVLLLARSLSGFRHAPEE
jgi:hypothetical protein